MLVFTFFRLSIIASGCFQYGKALKDKRLVMGWQQSSLTSNASISRSTKLKHFVSSNNSMILTNQKRLKSEDKQTTRSVKNRDLLLHFLFCVRTEQDLRDAVKNARMVGPTYTRINLCTRNLKISGIVDPVTLLTSIDVSNKWLDIRCQKLWGRCALDGQGLYSIIFGRKVNIKTHRVDFVNGRSNEVVAPTLTLYNSNATITQSLLHHNFGLEASCIYMFSQPEFKSSLTLQDVTFESNNAYVCAHTKKLYLL
jgi:hypothetical protein